jgi:hypothetical protein
MLTNIVLIAITATGGLLVYNVFFSTAGAVNVRTQVQVD